MDLLTATDITKNYANHTALDNLSIAVPEQSILDCWALTVPAKQHLSELLTR